MRFASTRFAIAFSCAHVAGVAGAQTDGLTSARLEVLSSDGCGSRVDLAARVRSRTTRIEFVEAGTELEIRARFQRSTAGGFLGEVVMVRAETASAPRQLVAQSCDDAVEGVALIIAVTLDPTAADASDAGMTGSNGAAADHAGDSLRRPDAAVASNDAAAASESKYATRRLPGEPRLERESNTGALGEPFSVGALVAGEAALGPAPGPMPGFALYLMIARDRVAPWSPAFGLGGSWVFDGEQAHWGGVASFSLAALTLDACALRLGSSRFEVRACASGLVGQLSATGTDVNGETEAVTRTFVALGPLATASFRLGSNVELAARLAPRFNLFRDAFEFRPRVFHEVAPVTLSVSLGLGVRWD